MKRAGFILANQLLAATIITVATAFFAINYCALSKQKQHMDEQLIAARLIKEAADDQHVGSYECDGLRVVHRDSRIEVEKDGQVLMQLWEK